MAEIDSIFSIKQLYSLLAIFEPLLERKGISDTKSLAEVIYPGNKKRGPDPFKLSLIDLLEEAYQAAEDPRKTKRMQKYQLFVDAYLNANPFSGAVPIFVNGLSLTTSGRRKKGLDPYSNSHRFSTHFLEDLEAWRESADIPLQFLRQFRFVYVQPVPFTQGIVEGEEGRLGLEDVLRETVEQVINPQLSGIGFGDLVKFDDLTPKRGNASYDPALLDAEVFKRQLASTPELVLEDINADRELVLSQRKYAAHLARQLLAALYGTVLEDSFAEMAPILKQLELKSLPLYMEKTSASAEVMQATAHYNQLALPFQFVGGEGGILATTPEKIPSEGICHPTARARLLGFLSSLYSVWSQETRRARVLISQRKKAERFSYISQEPYPHLLLEGQTHQQHPNLHDLAQETLSERDRELVSSFAYMHRLGFLRIEPRIVTLLTTDVSIYNGLRILDKSNRRWFEELKGKKVVMPDDIPDFLEMPSVRRGKGDLRGSLFAAGTFPRLTREWFEEGHTHSGCSIEKLIMLISNRKTEELLRKIVPTLSEEEQDTFFDYHFRDTFEPIFAQRGTAIHTLSSEPLEGLVHYQTLSRAGISPRPSDRYTETPFVHSIEGITISLHPDAYFFLERDNGYDIVIIDTKTNRVTQYPEHKYLTQTALYGLMIKEMVKEHLDIHVENIYCVLNKNAFYMGFGGEKVVPEPHATHRSQRFSPITLFTPDDPFMQVLPSIVRTTHQEMQELRQEGFAEYKAEQEGKKVCSGKCFQDKRIICDYLVGDAGERKRCF